MEEGQDPQIKALKDLGWGLVGLMIGMMFSTFMLISTMNKNTDMIVEAINQKQIAEGLRGMNNDTAYWEPEGHGHVHTYIGSGGDKTRITYYVAGERWRCEAGNGIYWCPPQAPAK